MWGSYITFRVIGGLDFFFFFFILRIWLPIGLFLFQVWTLSAKHQATELNAWIWIDRIKNSSWLASQSEFAVQCSNTKGNVYKTAVNYCLCGWLTNQTARDDGLLIAWWLINHTHSFPLENMITPLVLMS